MSDAREDTRGAVQLNRPIICWGAKGQAKVLHEFLSALGYEIIACFDNDRTLASPFTDVPLVGGWNSFSDWRATNPGPLSCVVAIGGASGCERLEVQRRLGAFGLQPVVVVHPTAFVAADATLGAGTQILAQAAVCADSHLGEACIVNTRASVDHECAIGNGVHIGPGATLCGEVIVHDCAFVGAGATILPRVHIGRAAIIGAGAVVIHDVPPEACVAGVPARAQIKIARG